MAAERERLDILVWQRRLASSRAQAQALILAGKVAVDGQCLTQCGARVDAQADVRLLGAPSPYVSRGGEKLAAGLAAFDCRKELERTRCPVLALHAADDAIVPLERAQRDFAGHVFRQRDDGGHGLGFNKRHWCVQAIADFLKAHALC